MKEHFRVKAEVVSALQKRLTDDQLAELETIYYLGVARWFPERYERHVEEHLRIAGLIPWSIMVA
jgi:hypothetical protein